MSKAEIAAGLTFTVIAGVGALLGGMAGEAMHDDGPADLRNKAAEIESMNEQVLEADLELDRLELELGETCASLLSNFGPEGQIIDWDEERIVEELQDVPQDPCGNNDIEVLAVTREYMTAANLVPQKQAALTELKSERANLEDDAEDNFEIWVGGFGGLVLAGAIGAFVATAVLDELDYRPSWR